jgi:Beta-fructosidases (levanase/invertase)
MLILQKSLPQKCLPRWKTENNRITLQILVDHSSIEIFANRGKVAISAVTYPSPSQTGVEIFSNNGKTKLESFKGWKLGSIWK